MKSNKALFFLCVVILFFSFANTFAKVPYYVLKEGGVGVNDSLPLVLPKDRKDVLYDNLTKEAEQRFNQFTLPKDMASWEKKRETLRNTIIEKNNVKFYPGLPFDVEETSMVQLDGYKIKNIIFQTRPNIFATANLFVPEGNGPFPAVLVMMGHSANGKLSDTYQSLGHMLALNGYVALLIDPWGQGERTTIHKEWEYHGAYRGATLLNVGETLMGMILTDNIRAIDFLSSLPYVDAKNIGATGSSGGGGQTMWLTAIEERVKAAVPVVAVGTMQSRVMGSNCVCEMLMDGLTFIEESGVLGLVAPRAIKMCNHTRDNPTFIPKEMLRSYNNAKPIFELYGAGNNIDYAIFELTHGYQHEDKEVMLGWFDLHLKDVGDGSPKKVAPFEYILRENKIMVFNKKKRDKRVVSTIEYCKERGQTLRDEMLSKNKIDIESKKNELKSILRLNEASKLSTAKDFGNEKGWDKLAIETSDNKLIPLLHIAPARGIKDYVIIPTCVPTPSIPTNKKIVVQRRIPSILINQLKEKGSGIIIVDLLGLGEASTLIPYRSRIFHGVSRAHWLLGKTMMGEWVQELNIIADFLKKNKKSQKITIKGMDEIGIAALLSSVLNDNVDQVELHGSPISYLVDNNEGIGHFSMATHIPRFLNWGDVSLAAALSGKKVVFHNAVTMSGNKIDEQLLKEYKAEYEHLKDICKLNGDVTFLQ